MHDDFVACFELPIIRMKPSSLEKLLVGYSLTIGLLVGVVTPDMGCVDTDWGGCTTAGAVVGTLPFIGCCLLAAPWLAWCERERAIEERDRQIEAMRNLEIITPEIFKSSDARENTKE
jgi:hypothetical protein